MRRAILFLISIVILAAGAYLLLYEVFFASVIRGRLLMASAGLMTVGGYVLWDDFIVPLLARSKQISKN
jgi:hypothetical protein